MKVGTFVLIALPAWWALTWLRGHVRRMEADRLPAGIMPVDRALRGLSEARHDACTDALKAFAATYRTTFLAGKCSREAVLALHDLRDAALKHMYDLRMRLPNDLEGERQLTQHIEDTDRLLRAYIGDAQGRCGELLLHPGPIDDAFYRQYYRAHNDVVV